MSSFVKVARRDDIAEGTGKTVETTGKPIALFDAAGRFYAIPNTRLHRQGPLGEGELDGAVVTCPRGCLCPREHGWQYDISTALIWTTKAARSPGSP